MACIQQFPATQDQSTLFEHLFQETENTEICSLYPYRSSSSFLWISSSVFRARPTCMHTGTHVPYSPMGFFPKINRHETHLRESSQYCPSSGNSEQKKISRFQIMDASIGAIWPYNETEQHAETQRGSDLPKVIQQMSAGAQVGTQAPGAPGPAPPREV